MSKKTSNTNDTEPKPDLVIEFHPHNAVLKELGDLHEEDRDAYIVSFGLMSKHKPPALEIKKLDTIDKNVFQMMIKGSEAWRCIYTTEVPGKIVVLHTTQKTTNGVDRQLKNVVEKRLKSLRDKLKDERKAAKKKPK